MTISENFKEIFILFSSLTSGFVLICGEILSLEWLLPEHLLTLKAIYACCIGFGSLDECAVESSIWLWVGFS
jgi:hypothetical protein